jgi:3-methylcrotonyl-CoA carboxylase alpha subunit
VLTRLLIANRGEIVCRIAQTARRMGVTSIAVYSDADRGARHVRMADEAFYLGAAPAAESYLDIARVLAVARQAGAEAVHPGYGFLSENAAFAQACLDAGLIFIGPPPAAIVAMGSKSASKAAMAAIGVPVAPGYHGRDQSLECLSAEAARVGFPLIIKASAGGGGKGMQVVESAAAVARAIESAQRLARTAFGDDRLLLERYFPQARHVEVQIFADTHGAVVALCDRDCSVQRRHQKVIEEAPAPGLRDEVRAAMAQAAIKTARAVDYVGAGTIEFLVDGQQQFYFMEMNTRLQVEHPVTELITGIDLVEWQLRVAQGERLPEHFAGIAARGVAVEARLYAEDPAQGYLPSVGTITHLRWPALAPGLRLDSGVDAGDAVSPFYDPMLAKIVAWGESRQQAVSRLRQALADIEMTGVTTNRALLASVLADVEFQAAFVATDFLERRRAQLAFGEPAACDEDAVVAALWCATRENGSGALWDDGSGWRMAARPCTRWRLRGGAIGAGAASGNASRGGAAVSGDAAVSDDRTVCIEQCAANLYLARLGVHEYPLRVIARTAESLHVELAGQAVRVNVVRLDQQLHLFSAGRPARPGGHVSFTVARTEDALEVSAAADEGSLLTPLPGTVVALHVSVGQQVTRGAALVTVEAMKMEHTLTAPHAGVIARIPFGVAERVTAGAVLIELSEPAP